MPYGGHCSPDTDWPLAASGDARMKLQKIQDYLNRI